MTIAATITRKLNIRFIDAKKLETTARLNLGITSYPNAEQTEALIQEITRIFYNEVPLANRKAMRANNENLVASKSPRKHIDDDDDCKSSVSTISTTASSSLASDSYSSPSPKKNKAKSRSPSPKSGRSPLRGVQSVATSIDLLIPEGFLDDEEETVVSKKGSRMQRFIASR